LNALKEKDEKDRYSSVALSQNSVFLRVTNLVGAVDLSRI